MIWKWMMLLWALGPVAWSFPAVPPEVWAIKENSGAPACGAVIVEEKAAYGKFSNTFELRIRIYNEAGKAAAKLQPFPFHTESVTGRTVYPDGREVPVSSVKDFGEQTLESHVFEGKRQVVVPPGVTADCVVDLRWVVSGTYLASWTFRRSLLAHFPIRFLQVSFPIDMPLTSAVLGGRSLHATRAPDPSTATLCYRFTDLPAWEDTPYSARSMDGWPSIFCFRPEPGISDMDPADPMAYWNQTAKGPFKRAYEAQLLGGAYRKLLQELHKDLPADPVQRTRELITRVEQRIRNTSNPTLEELAAQKQNGALGLHPDKDLNAIAEKGFATGAGIHNLLFQILKDSQLKPVLLFVVDRGNDVFQPGLATSFQFDSTILGVKTADGKGYAWFNAGLRFAPVGILRAAYQGTRGLLVDPEDWSAQLYTVPVQPSNLNLATYAYDLTLQDETDAFKVHASFAGLPAFYERNRYLAWEPTQQGDLLKKAFEARSKLLAVTRAEVQNVTDPARNVTWEVAGTNAVEPARTRDVAPFPGLAAPLWVPGLWPETRTKTILMPYCRIQTATSTFLVPRGWTLKAPPAIKEANAWGSVDWQAVATPGPEGTRVDVTFKVDASRMAGPAEAYLAFRTFLGWVDKGFHQGLVLVKEAGGGGEGFRAAGSK